MSSSQDSYNQNMNPPPPPSSRLVIKLKSQDGKELFFKIKRDTELKEVLTAYCNKRFLEYESIRFFINGEPFRHNKSPNQLGLEDGVEIEAMVMQSGGG